MQRADRLRKWTAQEICEYFDSHFSVTIAEMARIAGWSVEDVKELLMGDPHDQCC